MFAFIGWLHLQLFRLVFLVTVAVVRLPLKAVASTVKAILALLGEEVQRWASIGVAALMVFGLAKVAVAFNYPGKKWVLLVVVLFGCAWFYAVLKAISYTLHNNLRQVRTRQMFRALDRRTAQLPEQLNAMRQEATVQAAAKAKGTPLEGMFYANRSARAEEAEAERVAAEEAEAQRRVAAEQVARDQADAEARERRLDELAALEPDPYAHREG
jgi:hypothetical protein